MDTPETKEAESSWLHLQNKAAALDEENTPSQLLENQEEVQQEPEPSVAELLNPVIQITAEIFAPNWKLKTEECEQLSTAYGALIDKYMPDNSVAKFGIEINALLVTGMIVGARLSVPLREPKKEEKEISKGGSDEN